MTWFGNGRYAFVTGPFSVLREHAGTALAVVRRMVSEIPHVLVAYDGSETGLKSVEFAAQLTHALGGRGRVLFVYDLPAPAMMSMMRVDEHRLRVAAEQHAEQHLSAAARVFNDLRVPVETNLRFGHPAAEILDEIDRAQVDYVVLGSRGAALGGIGRRVLSLSKRPVTVVRGT